MEILNIGPLELIIILVIMFILLGPQEMIRTANRIGRWIRSFVRSPMWKEIMGYSQEIRELPQKIMDESGLQETVAEIKQTTQAAADELNSQIKEVTEAARVPEAEHLTLDKIGQTEEILSIKPDTLTVHPQPVPYAAETDAAQTGVTDPAVSAEAAAVVSTVLPPVELAHGTVQSAIEPVVQENAEPAVLSVAEPEPAPTTAEAPPAPRKRRVKSADVAGETPAPRTRRKKQEPVAAEVVSPTAETPSELEKPVAAQPPIVVPSADVEPVQAPRRGRPRKTSAPVETSGPDIVGAEAPMAKNGAQAAVPAPNGLDTAQPENGKSTHTGHAEVFEAEPEAAPVRKPRARRSPKNVEPSNGSGIQADSAGSQSDPEQVTPSDAA